jgi:membrane fusion protein (multidrug efflux system)
MSDHLPQAKVTPGLRRAGLIMAVIVVGVAAAGIAVRIHHARALEEEVEDRHVMVKVIYPEAGPGREGLVLPGDVRADIDAPIYARVSGYLKDWRTDIGARVKKGQLLGEIETPELDQQTERARADVAVAQSNWEIADLTAKRYRDLLASDSVSRQEVDEKAADAKARGEILNAARANLQALLAQQSFKRIVAPFDGVVSERNTDVGKLITSGSNNGQPLFRVVDNRKLRIYVETPQAYAHLILPGMTVAVTFPELAGQKFDGTVVGTSQAIREASRTSTVEVLLNNQDGKLLPGSYAEVHFDLQSQGNVFRLPVSALLFRRNGMQVATVGADNKVVLKSISIATDLGRTVEVASGVDANDMIIDSPSDSIAAGDVVRVKKPGEQPAAQGGGNRP